MDVGCSIKFRQYGQKDAASMTETFAQREGIKLWTVAHGSGIPVILCNGGPGCCDYLAPVASMLDDLAHVIRFEQRGCGRSDPAAIYTVETCLDDLEIVRQHYHLDRARIWLRMYSWWSGSQ